MNAKTVLAELRAAGIVIHADDGRLQLDAPTDTLTPNLLESVKGCKAELLELLLVPAKVSKADAEFDRFQRVAKPMRGGGLYCPVHGSPEMPSGIPGERWDAFIADCGRLGRGSKA